MSNNIKPAYIQQINFRINKLIKTLEYNYEIEVAEAPGNWPVVVIPRSGSFIANSKTKTVDSTIIFCPNTGICGSNNPDVLPYNIDYSCGFKNKDLLFTTLRLKVNEKNTNDYIYSSGQYIECINCFVSPEVIFSGNTILDKDTQNITNIDTLLSTLVPGQEYFWSFSNKASNWPAIISPMSGSFISSTDTYVLNSIFSFCKDASCSGLSGYLDYTQDDNSSSYQYLSLNFMLNSNNHCYFDHTNHSLMIVCDDCIPRPSILLDSEKLSLNNNCSDISVMISGLELYQGYDYYFSSHSANWPITISPISGSFITSNSTSLTLPFKVAFCGSEALCSGDPDLINYDINYNQLYSDTSCEKYAYIQYNLSKTPNFTIQNNSLIFPSNPITQSEILKVSCEDCLGSQVAKIQNKINVSIVPTGTGISPNIVPTGTGTML